MPNAKPHRSVTHFTEKAYKGGVVVERPAKYTAYGVDVDGVIHGDRAFDTLRGAKLAAELINRGNDIEIVINQNLDDASHVYSYMLPAFTDWLTFVADNWEEQYKN